MTADIVQRHIDAALAGAGIEQLLDSLAAESDRQSLDYGLLLQEAAVQACRRLAPGDSAYILHEAFNCLARSPAQCH